MSRNRFAILMSFLTTVALVLAVTPALADWAGNTPTGNGVLPVYRTDLPSNDECGPLGYDFGFKIGGAPNGTYYLTSAYGDLVSGAPEDAANSVTISNSDGHTFNWSATLGIDAVVVKAGSGANVFFYAPEATGDTGLYAPLTGDGPGDPGKIRDISHVTFCYDYEVDVSKDAHTSFTRMYHWSIDKSVTPDSWDLFKGDSGTSTYTVAVTKTGYTDNGWAVNGSIWIENNTPLDATITGVTDVISGFGAVAVNCPGGLSQVLASGATLTCTYNTGPQDSPNSNPFGDTNTATVTTSGTVGGGEATAGVVFGAPTTEVNASVNVTDSNGESWGPVSGSTSWTYTRTFECNGDAGAHGNIATIVETGQYDDASVTVRCYEPTVNKTVTTSFERKYLWKVEKSADPSELTLSLGQSFLVDYEILVDLDTSVYTDGWVDSKWKVEGTITVTNPHPTQTMTVTLKDVIQPGAIMATLDCDGVLTVAAGSSGTCGYSAMLPDGTNRTNVATARLLGYDYSSPTKDVIFGAPATEVDECVTLTDSFFPDEVLATVCYGPGGAEFVGAPYTKTYARTLGPYDVCGEYVVENTATIVTKDTGTSHQDTATVTINVPCEGGCTLTPGYWKTHSRLGPAPYDDNWANLPDYNENMVADEHDEPFFLSGQTYYEVLWTSPKGGNAYYILAHAYIAAELNFLNGADPSTVQATFDEATTLFETYTPDDVGAAKGKNGKELRDQFIALAGVLDDYNNGLIGPGHCSEDSRSAPPEE